MQKPRASESVSTTAVPPKGSRGNCGRLTIGRMVVAGGILALLASAAWCASRFDPLGRAAAAYSRRQYATALKAARDHLGVFPSDQAAALMAARCLGRMGRPADAEPFYRRAEPLGPDDLQARAFGLVQSASPREAARVYEELLSLRPDDALALKRLAAVRMGLKESRAVLAISERLCRMPSEQVAGLTLAAIAHHESKHHAEAVDAGRRVFEIDPDLRAMPLPPTLFWNNVALDLLALGRAEEAGAYLERALVRSEDAGLMEVLGLSYAQRGLTEQAERCWRQAERWNPQNADVCLDLGRLALGRRQWREAIGFFRRAADRSRDAIEPLYNLSQAYRMLGDRATAEHYRRLADERRRSRPPARTGMGADADAASVEGTPISAREPVR